MKILFLSPFMDAEHGLVQTLRERGVSVLFAPTPQEAWQMLQLHGTSVDLAVVHREAQDGSGEPGFEFIQRIKANPKHVDLPFIVTTQAWKDAECATHQEGPLGANAYLHVDPKSDVFQNPEPFLSLMEAVLGQPIRQEETVTRSVPSAIAAPRETPKEEPTPELTEASDLFEASGVKTESTGSIQLEDPSNVSSSVSTTATPPPFSLKKGTSVDLAVQPPDPELERTVASQQMDLGSIQLSQSIERVQAPGAVQGKDLPDLSRLIEETKAKRKESSPPEPSFEPMTVEERSTVEAEVFKSMPYLLKDEVKGGEMPVPAIPPAFSAQGDAVIPGGAAHAPDVETLKKYLMLREQDVVALSAQVKTLKEQVTAQAAQLSVERARADELEHLSRSQQQRLDDADRDSRARMESLHKENDELRFQLRAKTDRVIGLEKKVKQATDDLEGLKERVRNDIRKIRAREKELENRLEILKKDSEVLIGSRENKIIELKRKLDILEFNMDLLQDRYDQEKESSKAMRERLERAAQAMRVADGFLKSVDEENEAQAGAASGAPGAADLSQNGGSGQRAS